MERQLTGIELVEAVSKSKARFRLKFGQQAAPVWASREDVEHFGRYLLALGLHFTAAGAKEPDPSQPIEMPEPLQCTRLAVQPLADGTSLLVMFTGATLLPVVVSTSDIRQALALLDTAAQGGMPPGPGTVQ